MHHKKLSAALLFVALVALGYFGVQYFNPSLFADREFRQQPAPDHSAIEKQERAKPRFNGVINGYFIAPPGTSIPEEYTTFEDTCGSATTTQSVSLDRAGIYDLDLELPPEYTLVSKQVVACGDVVTGTVWEYEGPLQATGIAAYVSIGRSGSDYDEMDIAFDRPRVIMTGGRDAIIVDPLTEDGYGQMARAWIPEPFGNTSLHTADLSKSEFLRLLRIVAQATRQ